MALLKYLFPITTPNVSELAISRRSPVGHSLLVLVAVLALVIYEGRRPNRRSATRRSGSRPGGRLTRTLLRYARDSLDGGVVSCSSGYADLRLLGRGGLVRTCLPLADF